MSDHQGKLPKGWRIFNLNELCNFIRGVNFTRNEAKNVPDEGYLPVLRAGNIKDELILDDDLVWVPSKNISNEQKLQIDDVVICLSSGSAKVVGKTAKLKEEFSGAVGAFCGIIRVNQIDFADKDYIAYWFRSPSYFEWRDSQARGANIQNLRFSELETLPIPLPPMDEQRRIVAALDEKLAAVERARVAAAAQLEAARALPAAYLRSVFEGAESQGWPRVKIDDISTLVRDGPHVTPTYVPQGIPFVTVLNIVNRKIDFSDLRYITPEDHAEFSSRAKAERGDILYTKDGTLGIPCVVDTDREFSFFVSVALIKLKKDLADPYYVAYVLESPDVLKQVELLAAGAGLKHMVLKSIRALEIPLPPLKKQEELASELKNQFAKTEGIQKVISTQLADIEALPGAYLRQAFAGAL